MIKIKIIFLSAGMGTRMLPLTRNTPKCLLDLGLGTTIIEHQINTIVEYNKTATKKVDEIVFVIGYLAEQIEAKLPKYQAKYQDKIKIKVVHNPFYDVSNNLMTLWMAMNEMDDEFIVINGDNVFKRNVLEAIAHKDIKEDICMVTDKRADYDEDDMKVMMNDLGVTKVSKKIPIDQAHGESVGMIRFKENGINIIKNVLSKMARDPVNRDVFYLEAMQHIMDNYGPVKSVMIHQDDWTEIDFHSELDILKNKVFDDIKRFVALEKEQQ